jgi:hypothetical protein
MRIPVQYFDGTFDYVSANRLESLIRNRKIIGFRRNDGWIRVPQGHLRTGEDKRYQGPERRSTEE